VEKTTLEFYNKMAKELAGTGRRLMEHIAGYE
jgi:rubrerythrin